MEDRDTSKPEGNPPEPRDLNDDMPEPKDRELDNMMIMDYEVYSVKLNNGTIEKIINHSNNTSNFDAESIAKTIVAKDNGLQIGNLYINKYSYNYTNDTIVIINTKNINDRLVFTLILSIIVLILFEIIIITKRFHSRCFA